MKEFEMLVRIKVFPDPEFCTGNLEFTTQKGCDYFDSINECCNMFLKDLDGLIAVDENPDGYFMVKCDECKDHYIQQKQSNDRNRITSETIKSLSGSEIIPFNKRQNGK